MPEAIIRWWRHALDCIRPRYVYAVVYTIHHPYTLEAAPVFFRTERAALRFMDTEEKTDLSIYNGSASHQLLKYKFYA